MTAPRPTGSIDIWNFVDNVTGTTVRKWLRDSWARRKIVALQQAVAGIVVPTASTANPAMDGTATPGSSASWSRGDHVHPKDTSKADKADTYTKSEVDGMIPTVPNASSITPSMDGTGAAGTSDDYARADHVHPADTSKQDALTSAQLSAVNSGATANDFAINNASVLCTITPIEPTLTSGSHDSTYGGCWYYKRGCTVTVHIGVTGLTASTDTTIFTLPAGYRPRSIIGFVGNATSTTNYGRARIGTDGTVHVNPTSTRMVAQITFDAFS